MSSCRMSGLCAFLFILCLAVSAVAQEPYQRNWPQWRGPAGNGIVEHGSPPLEWSETNNVKWKVPVPGKGYSTPIIWENKIFLLSAVPVEGSDQLAFTVFCLDRATGQTLWQKVARVDTPFQTIQENNTYASGSPVTDGERLVVSFGSYGVYCYDLDGNLLWERDLGKVTVEFGEGSSPAIAAGVVVVVQDNEGPSYVYGLDLATGEELWKKPRDETSNYTTPFVLTREGTTQVIIPGSTAVRSYNPLTGDVLWQCSGLGTNVAPMVVVDADTVYAMSGRRDTPRAIAVRLGGSGDLTGTDAVRWQLNRGTPYVLSPMLYEGRLYFVQHVTQVFSCVSAATGEPIHDQVRLPGVQEFYASPIAVNDCVYMLSREGTMLVLESSDALNILYQNKLDDRFEASPAVVGNEMYLRGNEFLYCIAEE